MARTARERFDAKIELSPDGCWLWTASRFANGYGKFNDGGRCRLAHRWAYEHFIGAVPEGLDLDHLCRVRHCVNPAHMEPVTRRENLIRGETLIAAQVSRIECPRGHPYDGENTRMEGTERHCRTCDSSGSRGRKAVLA